MIGVDPDRPETTSIAWTSDIAVGQAAATATKRRILVFFHSESSPESRHLDTVVFADPAVAKAINDGFVPVRLNFEQHRTFAVKAGALMPGVVHVYRSDGQPAGRVTEKLPPQEFLRKVQAF